MNWEKWQSPRIWDKHDYWAIGDVNKDIQYSILARENDYILKASFLDGSDEQRIGKFKNVSKAQLVAQMIDEG